MSWRRRAGQRGSAGPARGRDSEFFSGHALLVPAQRESEGRDALVVAPAGRAPLADRVLPENAEVAGSLGLPKLLLARAGKEAARLRDVPRDLRAQVLRAAEFALVAQALPEAHLHLTAADIFREIQQVAFDAERPASKRGPHADVGRRAIPPPAHLGLGSIDALAGEQFLLRRQVQRGE